MIRPRIRFCLALLTAVLAACGSSPPVRYYSLEPGVVPESPKKRDAELLAFGPLRMPEYLERAQIVTRGAGTEMTVHEFARWAEPVDKAVHRVVAARLDSELDDVIVVAYPYLRTLPVSYRVLGQVDRFDADTAGRIILQLQWTVIENEERALIPPRRTRYETRAADPTDPDAIARAMSEALGRFSDDLAARLGDALEAKAATD